MIKPALVCLCFCLLAGCQTPVPLPKLHPPQEARRDAAAKEFFRRVRYPYIGSRARQRLIERIVSGELDYGKTGAQLLALLGPPDWKEDLDGYPPELPPAEVWNYVHTWNRPMTPTYRGKIIYFLVHKDKAGSIEAMSQDGIQKISR